MSRTSQGRTQRVARALIPVGSVLGTLALWELAVHVLDIKRFILPPPSMIVSQGIEDWSRLVPHVQVTALEAAMGLMLGLGFAVIAATVMFYVRPLRAALMPLVVIDQSIPKLALAPLFVIWFGYGMSSKVLIAALISFFPVLISTLQGYSSVDPRLDALMRSLAASRWQVFLSVRGPHTLPYVFSGLKVAVPLSVIGAVVGEFVQASRGLGYWILLSVTRVDTPGVFVAIALLAGISLSYFGIVLLLERGLLRKRFSQLLESRSLTT